MFGDGVEIVAGDVADCDSLAGALAGCDGVHISVGGPVDQLSAENVAALAPQQGVQRITYVSGSSVAPENAWFPMTAQKLQAEAAVQNCGVGYTIFCPTWPMEQLPRFVAGGRALVVGVGVAPWHWFAAADFGSMVATAYRQEEAIGKRLYVHGPEAMTSAEALARYCCVFHPEIDSVTIMPVDAAREAAAAMGNTLLGQYAELMAYFKAVGERGDPAEANRLLGAPSTTLAAWLEQKKRAQPIAA
jgi:uncharacterized protein YbjT (DUF2867 family)